MRNTFFNTISKLIVTGILLAWFNSVLATPSPAQWLREVLVGSDTENYYTFEATFSQPGSNYRQHKHTDFVVRNKKSGKAIKRIAIADVDLSLDEDHPENGKWTAKHNPLKQEDLNVYLQSKSLEWLFAEDDEYIKNYAASSEGLSYKTRKGNVVVPYKFAPRQLFSAELGSSAIIISVFSDKENLYLLAEGGMAAMDTPFVREILVVDLKTLRTARENLLRR